jgi:uncharacterized LabA/DUF88 family protein
MAAAWVYIDGYNLFHGAVDGTPYCWLDLNALCQRLLPEHTVDRIKYFTANVTTTGKNPQKPVRQQIYNRALETLRNITIFRGNFATHDKLMPVAGCKETRACTVSVVRMEEKGSDVNLATHLVHDAHLRRFELAVVITGDADLLSPIRLVKEELKLPIGVINPRESLMEDLQKAATFYRSIRKSVLAGCQFPRHAPRRSRRDYRAARVERGSAHEDQTHRDDQRLSDVWQEHQVPNQSYREQVASLPRARGLTPNDPATKSRLDGRGGLVVGDAPTVARLFALKHFHELHHRPGVISHARGAQASCCPSVSRVCCGHDAHPCDARRFLGRDPVRRERSSGHGVTNRIAAGHLRRGRRRGPRGVVRPRPPDGEAHATREFRCGRPSRSAGGEPRRQDALCGSEQAQRCAGAANR